MRNSKRADIGQLIQDFSGTLFDAVGSLSGLRGWFAEFIASDQFASMEPAEKKHAFNTYDCLLTVLEECLRINSDS